MRALGTRATLTVTGQLGDVMKESAQAALSWVRGHAPADDELVRHARPAPARARPARSRRTGRAPASRWRRRSMSLVTGRPVRDDTAMTGEITLTGQVLPIGGLKEKALAAQRAGHHARDRPAPQRAGPRGHPRAPARGPRVRLGRRDRRGARRRARTGRGDARRNGAGFAGERPGVCSPDRRIQNDERWHGSEEESGQGRRCRRSGEKEPVRPAPGRGRGSAREPLERLRVRPRRGRPAPERQAPDQADLRRQEAAEGHQGSRGILQGGLDRPARGAEEGRSAAGSASCS